MAEIFCARFIAMLARRQELNTQFHQLVDSFVMAVALFAVGVIIVLSTGAPQPKAKPVNVQPLSVKAAS